MVGFAVALPTLRSLRSLKLIILLIFDKQYNWQQSVITLGEKSTEKSESEIRHKKINTKPITSSEGGIWLQSVSGGLRQKAGFLSRGRLFLRKLEDSERRVGRAIAKPTSKK